MFSQEQLIENINIELSKELGNLNIKHYYERLCGRLKLEDIFATDTVVIAATRCSSGFMNKPDTQRFMAGLNANSYLLCQKVLKGTFRPSYYKTREITERGKKRLIKPPTFECKVVQKVICDWLIRPLLEPKMISTNYASIKGRGTGKMYADIEKALNKAIKNSTEFSVVTADFTSYFASINTNILIDMLSKYIKDKRIVDLIKMFSPDDYGLSLGNELSQIPASWLPSMIDHTMKDKYQLEYFRYMDDSLCLVPKGMEGGYIRSYQALAAKLELKCKDEKFKVVKTKRSFRFCKERFVWNDKKQCYERLINPKIISNERRKLKSFTKKIENHEMLKEGAAAQYGSVIGSIKRHPHTFKAVADLEKMAAPIMV